jgi:hypothetical protein
MVIFRFFSAICFFILGTLPSTAQISFKEFNIYGLNPNKTIKEILNESNESFGKIQSFNLSAHNDFGIQRNININEPYIEEVVKFTEFWPIIQNMNLSLTNDKGRQCNISLTYIPPFNINCAEVINGGDIDAIADALIAKYGPPSQRQSQFLSWDCVEQIEYGPNNTRPACNFRVTLQNTNTNLGPAVSLNAAFQVTQLQEAAQQYQEKLQALKQKAVGKGDANPVVPKF